MKTHTILLLAAGVVLVAALRKKAQAAKEEKDLTAPVGFFPPVTVVAEVPKKAILPAAPKVVIKQPAPKKNYVTKDNSAWAIPDFLRGPEPKSKFDSSLLVY